MRGYIRKRGSTYAITVSAGFDPITKKRVQKYATARTQAEAQRDLTRILRDLDTGSSADPGRLKLGQYLSDQWLPHMVTRVRPRTLVRYRQLLNLHILPKIGSVPLAKLRPAHV
jgi:hypothetical protein